MACVIKLDDSSSGGLHRILTLYQKAITLSFLSGSQSAKLPRSVDRGAGENDWRNESTGTLGGDVP